MTVLLTLILLLGTKAVTNMEEPNLKEFFLEVPALRVNQPLGEFYVVKFKARDLLDLTFSEPLEYIDEFGNVKGSQRPKKETRLKEIAKYVDSVEMAFPNSIILAANYSQNGKITHDPRIRWRVIEDTECGIHKIQIPKKAKLAAIIDGQHRLNAFQYVKKEERFEDLQLVCSVYLDLPNSYQAFLFATINSNQKRVDRSLALEQFGFNVGDEPERSWTPEKLAVFLTRKLNLDKNDSPFYKHVKVAPLNSERLFGDGLENINWFVSTATVVDGILSLFSSNPKRDRIEMQQHSVFKGRNRSLLKDIRDFSPLRDYFMENRDNEILNIVKKYFLSIKTHLWNNKKESSYINKTVGVQACFDLLKEILKSNIENDPFNVNFDQYVAPSSQIDFSDKFFQASGIGRGRIKRVLYVSAGLLSLDNLKSTERGIISSILDRSKEVFEDRWFWEDETERRITGILESVEWLFKAKKVRIYKEEYDKYEEFDSFEEFIDYLISEVEGEFYATIPSDEDMRKMAEKSFDAEEYVTNALSEYSNNLMELGWGPLF